LHGLLGYYLWEYAFGAPITVAGVLVHEWCVIADTQFPQDSRPVVHDTMNVIAKVNAAVHPYAVEQKGKN